MQLSAIIITRNEQSQILDCLAALDFADEVIVVDNASADNTAELARQWGAKVHVAPDWPGFGPQKNRVLALATGDWVLSVDADERISPALRAEILHVIARPVGPVAYRFPRLSSYCGQFMRHSGWYPDRVLRLFRRGQAKFSEDLVHERVLTQGQVADLSEPLVHLSFPDFESVLDKVNRYSTAGSQAMVTKGKNASLTAAVGHGLWAFFRTYVLRRGFLDGQLGLALAISNAEGTYYRYAKRWLHERCKADQHNG
ncbi:MAG: glycosyltransferase family 2 protein [Comamonadaceae bacterium]|nr:glycosyltransferase family 2 protein [Comamonadaceae bacterium]